MSEELKLTATRALGGYERQFAIESNHSELEGKWEDRYVHFAGYFGPYKPELFAAAPDLLAFAKRVDDNMGYIHGGIDNHPGHAPDCNQWLKDALEIWRECKAAIAKAEGRAE